MFDILLESRKPRERVMLSRGSIGSLATHGAIVAVLAATASGGALYLSGPIERAIFLAPLRQEASKPIAERLSFLPGSDGIAFDEGVQGAAIADALLTSGGRGGGTLRAGEGTNRTGFNNLEIAEVAAPAFTEIQVDSIAERDPSSAAPAYPAKLLAAGVQGLTIVQFIVDSTGHVDLRSFREVHASHPLFTVAVYDALPGMKYRPGSIGGRPVRQLVQQEFIFRILPPKPAM